MADERAPAEIPTVGVVSGGVTTAGVVSAWNPSVNLRWTERTVITPRVLQQQWFDAFSGKTEWRTIPTVEIDE